MATKLFDTTIVAPRKGVRTLFCGWTVSAVAREQPWGHVLHRRTGLSRSVLAPTYAISRPELAPSSQIAQRPTRKRKH